MRCPYRFLKAIETRQERKGRATHSFAYSFPSNVTYRLTPGPIQESFFVYTGFRGRAYLFTSNFLWAKGKVL